MYRTHTCGELTKSEIGKEVTLCGWVHARRDHGGIIFIDLRDRYGITQIVFDPQNNAEIHKFAETLRREYVLKVKGEVRARKEGMENPNLATGDIEVIINELTILSESEVPPLEIDDRVHVNEDFRLRYRFLDLRKQGMQKNIITRHKVLQVTRKYLNENNFLEIETPILARSTPEGARDYLVPSRVHPGKFYALPQSPQLFKQTLMIAGFDRYYQIARCFRDEDLRADRQPEFTQIDYEMSFVDEEDVMAVTEGLLKSIWKEVLNIDIPTPFPRIKYDEAIKRFGTDRPDTRFGLELIEVPTEIVNNSDFGVFKNVVAKGGIVKCINAKGCGEFSRKEIDEMTEFVGIYGAKGLAWMKMKDKLESSIVKFFNEDVQKKLIELMKAEHGDLLLFVADDAKVVNDSLAHLRLYLGKKLGLIDSNKFNFLWVVDFPMFEWDDETNRLVAMHHPFTSPKEVDIDLMESDPLRVRAKAYDVVLNGVELGGGSIRIHDKNVQKMVFNAIKIGDEEARNKFGFLLDALTFGAPPHGGLAIGFDRLCAMVVGKESIRDVIAFPKNKAAQGVMDDSPNFVSNEQLKELHLKLDIVKKE